MRISFFNMNIEVWLKIMMLWLEIINYKIEKHLSSKLLNNQINLSKSSSVKRGLGYVDESTTPSCVNTNFAKAKKVIPN